MSLLGRGAKVLARRSERRLAAAGVRKSIERLRTLLEEERACKLRQGDVLIELIDRHHLRAIDIARQTRQRPNDLSQMYRTCRMFPPRVRRKDVPYNCYFLAMRMVRKFKGLQLKPLQVLAEIRRLGFSQHRDVTAHFSALSRQEENERAARLADIVAPARPFNHAYHARFQTLLSIFPDKSIKVLHIDPPYVYPKRHEGRYTGASARRKTCDNSAAVDAISLVTDLLRDWQPKLRAGGAVLLWQPSGPLTGQIAAAIDRYRWALERVVIWDKGRAQAGDFGSAYSTQTEWLWVLKRPGDRLLNHDASPRGDILRFAPVSTPTLAGEQEHAFEKPVQLCRFLVGKHSHERELVFDACACTGSMSIAAIEMNRQWVYAESNPINYEHGAARIARHLYIDRGRAAG